MRALATPQKSVIGKQPVEENGAAASGGNPSSGSGVVRKSMCTPSKTTTPVKSPDYKKGKVDETNPASCHDELHGASVAVAPEQPMCSPNPKSLKADGDAVMAIVTRLSNTWWDIGCHPCFHHFAVHF